MGGAAAGLGMHFLILRLPAYMHTIHGQTDRAASIKCKAFLIKLVPQTGARIVWVWPDHCEGGWSGNIRDTYLFYRSYSSGNYEHSYHIIQPYAIIEGRGCYIL